MRENRVVLPHGVARRLYLAARHTTVCLDTYCILLNYT